jgi:general stress protein 26
MKPSAASSTDLISASWPPTDADGKPQTSVIYIKREGDHILFSTIKGRRKTTIMGRDSRVNLLVQSLPVLGPNYVSVSGTVELLDDPDGSFHQEMYASTWGEPLHPLNRERSG